MKTIRLGIAMLLTFGCANLVSSQAVNNGSVTGSPAANNGITSGYAPGWSTFSFSPDLCNVVFASYTGNSQVPRIASPDGGTWLGIASLGEAAQTTITGLTVGASYTLYWCGANFGTGALYNGTPANPTIAVVGAASTTVLIPQVANTWNSYSLPFVATAATMTLRCTITGGSTYASLDGFNLSGSLCNPVPLPVEFVKFGGRFEDCHVNLSWESPVSEYAKDFEIQRSADGELFETLEKLSAEGQKVGHWEDPYPMESAYYRIRMYNETGRVAESPVLAVNGECTTPQVIVLGNPVHDAAFASVKFTSRGAHGTLTVTDMNGRLVGTYRIDANAGAWNDFQLPVAGLRPGVYLIFSQDGAETKMVIQ